MSCLENDNTPFEIRRTIPLKNKTNTNSPTFDERIFLNPNSTLNLTSKLQKFKEMKTETVSPKENQICRHLRRSMDIPNFRKTMSTFGCNFNFKSPNINYYPNSPCQNKKVNQYLDKL